MWPFNFLSFSRTYYGIFDIDFLTIRRRYWSSIQKLRHESDFPAPRTFHSQVVNSRPNRPRSPCAITILRARFQRKRRQVLKTHLTRLSHQ